MSPQTLLFAIDFDTIFAIAVIVIGLLSTLAQAISQQRAQKKKAEQQRAAPRPQPAAGPVQPAAGPARPAAGPAAPAAPQPRRPEGVDQEIADFLRRAAEGRAAKSRPAQGGAMPAAAGRPAARPAQARPVASRPAQSGPIQRRPSQPGAPPARPVQSRPAPARDVQAPVAAEIVQPSAGPVGGRVKAAVTKDLDTSEFRQRANRLGQETRRVSERTQKRLQALQEKFDLELSSGFSQASTDSVTTATSASGVTEIPPTAAAGFAAMLRDVDSVRQAIVLNEILTRPIDRW